MAEACEKRAQEAAMKEAQAGKTTNRQQWSESEIERFNGALVKYRSSSNVKLAEAIGTRTTSQVNIFKFWFLKNNPNWLHDNNHTATGSDNVGSHAATPLVPLSTPSSRTTAIPSIPIKRLSVGRHGSLVPVSSTHRCAYTPGLSTSSSSTFLQDSQGVRENSSRGKFRA